VVPRFSIAIIRESPKAENTPSSQTIIKYLAYSKKKRVTINTTMKQRAIMEINSQFPSKRPYPHPNIYATYIGFDQKSSE